LKLAVVPLVGAWGRQESSERESVSARERRRKEDFIAFGTWR
jgi:hypothetical protein